MKKIAIIGASYLQLPLVHKAKEMGIETHVFAWEKDAVCKPIADFFYPISTLEKKKILECCYKIHPDGILSIGSDIAMPTVNSIANKLNLVSNSMECTHLTTNKYAMKNVFKDSEIPCADFKKVYYGSNSQQITNEFQFPFIVKPTDRSGSRGVTLVNDRKQLTPAIEYAYNESLLKEIVVESFVEGREISVEMISWEGRHFFVAATDKITTGAPFFVETVQKQPAEISSELKEKIISLVKKALDVLKVEYGASHTELIISDKGDIYVNEVAGRMGGDFIGSDLVYLSTGYDFVKGVIQISIGEFEHPAAKWGKYAGVLFLGKETSHLLKYFEDGADDIFIKKELFHNKLVTLKNSADRSGYLMYQSDIGLKI